MYSNHITQQYPLVNGKHSPADIAHQQPSAHWLRQMTDAHQSRQRASPHHHARQAAALARTSTLSLLPTNNLKERPNHAEKPQATWTELDMGGMGLQQLAQSLAHHYTFLTKLYINHNNLTSLPRSLMNLQHLQVLDASSNQLATVPEELGLLVNLRELLLFDNCLVSLPTELGTLYQLETLGLEGNPIDPSLRQILADEGSAAVIMSLRENAEGNVLPLASRARHIITKLPPSPLFLPTQSIAPLFLRSHYGLLCSVQLVCHLLSANGSPSPRMKMTQVHVDEIA